MCATHSIVILSMLLLEMDLTPTCFVQTPAGWCKIGTCDANVAARTTSDGLSRLVPLKPINLYDLEDLELPSAEMARVRAEAELQSTCTGSPFRAYAAGRIAVRRVPSGEVGVGFDSPRLAPHYARLHYCAAPDGLWYLIPRNRDWPREDGINALKIPFETLDRFPRRGEPGVEYEAWLDYKVKHHLTETSDEWGGAFLDDLVSTKTLKKGFIDFAWPSGGQFTVYELKDGLLVGHREMRDTPHERAISYDSSKKYKVDFTGPFRVLQLAPDQFYTLHPNGAVYAYNTAVPGGEPQRIASGGSNVILRLGLKDITITSSQYKIVITPSGAASEIKAQPAIVVK